MKKDSADGRLLVWICSMNMIKDKDILRTIVDYEKELLMANFDMKQKNTLKHYFAYASYKYTHNLYLIIE